MRIPEPSGRQAWLDGAWVPLEQVAIHVSDPAFHAGLGLFETIAVRDRSLLDLDEHLRRMRDGASVLGIPLRPADELRAAALDAASRESSPFAWLKLVATRGGLHVAFTGPMDPGDEGRVVSAVTLSGRRSPDDPLVRVKTLNHAASALGLEEARRRGADEGLWHNTRGHLTEGCTSSLFVVHRRRLFTPGLRDGILPGVVRALALGAARALRLVVHEGKLRVPRLLVADEAFLTSSLRGVRPLVRVDGRPIGNGEPGPLTAAIAAALVSRRRRSSPDDRVS